MVNLNGLVSQWNLKPGSVVAIDGRCGAGKTTLAQAIAKTYQAEVIQMDSFFLPPELRTAQRLAQPGGNVHYERLLEQVLVPLSQGEPVRYGRFDCQRQEIVEQLLVDTTRPIVVEGSYSLRPELRPYYTQRVFLDIDAPTQRQRILQRNGQAGLAMFEQRWIPLEEAYFSHYDIAHQADIVIDGAGTY